MKIDRGGRIEVSVLQPVYNLGSSRGDCLC